MIISDIMWCNSLISVFLYIGTSSTTTLFPYKLSILIKF